jgi:cytochrome c oxidase subunit I+III
MSLPSPLPRPPGELEALERAWKVPVGWRRLSAVNNTAVGVYYLGTALLFFVLAGVLALVMRTQLAVPENDLVSPSTYNQLFTMHGTVMMFLFAVPAVEAVGVLLLPNMVGARDLPFPRLGAYAFWAYFFGGLAFFASLFFGAAPDGGWTLYPPLSGLRYSSEVNADLWLLGIGFIEISAIAGAIEIIVGVLRTRAPGMTLDRLPVFAWAMLVIAAMIVFAFPAIILATLLLELERAFDWPFFIAQRGGDPLLWQHLFWFFGHPEVYIIFLPAAGMVSMILPTMARTPLAGARYVVLALAGTGFLSFGLWVHHMFATGIPRLSLSFFSAASMAVAIPAGIQVFAWIATLAKGTLRYRPPALFVLAFLWTFVIGGLTGVMLAAVPFDQQVHDTYFVVAHLHYVLFGGMVFPLFAALYYWAPSLSRNPLSDRLGGWACALMFLGFQVAFFPMHFAGLAGMPRRVYTYHADQGLDLVNLVSTLGAFAVAAGVALVIVDLARNFRFTFDAPAGDVYGGGTLEWLPTGEYGVRSIPRVESAYPLWDRPALKEEVEAGAHYLPGTVTGRRETLVTSAIDAQPQYVLVVPGPGWSPFVAAAATAAFFYMLTFKWMVAAAACAAVAAAAIVRWVWDTDHGPLREPADVGGGLRLPVYATGSRSHAWWASVVLILVCATLYASLVFSYLYLWTVAPRQWPDAAAMPAWAFPLASLALAVGAAVALRAADRGLSRDNLRWSMALLVAAALALAASFGVDLIGLRRAGLAPTGSGYGAAVAMILSVQGFFVAVVAAMTAYTVARAVAGRLGAIRRGTFDQAMLMARYAIGQGLAGIALVHGFPRVVG